MSIDEELENRFYPVEFLIEKIGKDKRLRNIKLIIHKTAKERIVGLSIGIKYEDSNTQYQDGIPIDSGLCLFGDDKSINEFSTWLFNDKEFATKIRKKITDELIPTYTLLDMADYGFELFLTSTGSGDGYYKIYKGVDSNEQLSSIQINFED